MSSRTLPEAETVQSVIRLGGTDPTATASGPPTFLRDLVEAAAILVFLAGLAAVALAAGA